MGTAGRSRGVALAAKLDGQETVWIADSPRVGCTGQVGRSEPPYLADMAAGWLGPSGIGLKLAIRAVPRLCLLGGCGAVSAGEVAGQRRAPFDPIARQASGSSPAATTILIASHGTKSSAPYRIALLASREATSIRTGTPTV